MISKKEVTAMSFAELFGLGILVSLTIAHMRRTWKYQGMYVLDVILLGMALLVILVGHYKVNLPKVF